MLAFEMLAERKIADAIERGELDGLPDAGRRLTLDDDALVPQDLRLAYRILKNAGFVPPEVDARRAIAEIERWLHAEAASTGDPARAQAERRLALLRASIARRHVERALR